MTHRLVLDYPLAVCFHPSLVVVEAVSGVEVRPWQGLGLVVEEEPAFAHLSWAAPRPVRRWLEKLPAWVAQAVVEWVEAPQASDLCPHVGSLL